MARLGRRPGHVDTRTEILRAARAVFLESGYTGASVRGVARRAGVDAALVHHYFGDKTALFVAAMDLPGDPRDVAVGAEVDGSTSGERVVLGFLALWEHGGHAGRSFRNLAQAICESPRSAAVVREFLAERVWTGKGMAADGTEALRHSLVAAQLLGIAWARYVMAVEPLASADPAEIAGWVGPTIDRYVTADLAGPSR